MNHVTLLMLLLLPSYFFTCFHIKRCGKLARSGRHVGSEILKKQAQTCPPTLEPQWTQFLFRTDATSCPWWTNGRTASSRLTNRRTGRHG